LTTAHSPLPQNTSRSDKRIEFWIRQSLRHLDFREKTVLDVGAGTGTFTCYLAQRGARHVVALEPDLDGSGSGAGLATLSDRVQSLGLKNVSSSNQTFQSYETEKRFDIVLLHAVINHLDETAVMVAHEAEWARDRYRQLLGKVYQLLTPGGVAIIADCARDNVFPLLGRRNPFAPTIEWHKHQNPTIWRALCRDVGFRNIQLNWATPNRLRRFGWLVNNWPAAFLLHSHFILHAYRPAGN
jgi:SAM-dependent methyltransferase